MTPINATISSDIHPARLPVSEAALQTLAIRMRPAGILFAAAAANGQLAFHDIEAGLFFRRYALPLIEATGPSGAALRELFAATGAFPTVTTLPSLPGLVLGIMPHLERRHTNGYFVLVARSAEFGLNEDVLRACGRLGLDGTWLAQQANALPVYSPDALQGQLRLLGSMMSDQLRLINLESELNSLSGQLASTYEELSLIYQISGGMKINRSASDFFKQACLDVLEVISVRGMGVALREGNIHGQKPMLYGTLALPAGGVERLSMQLIATLGERKNPLLINNLREDPAYSWLSAHATQMLAVPLQRQEQVLGCLFALNKVEGDFDSVDSKLLNSIANESAIYLENAMLFEDVHGLMMGLLHSLTSAVDAKDAYTCGHSERVAVLSRSLAQEIKLPEPLVERIYMAGLLHDVGKIGVPEAVLQKTGKLTAEEFDLMKKHPQIGARILRDIKQIEDIIPGVLYHHERYDGKGYPSGLGGENIPLMGRIICLADCFDAMTSNRTYRQALAPEFALREIERCAGAQFDPVLARTFVGIGVERMTALLLEQQRQSQQLTDLQQTLRAS